MPVYRIEIKPLSRHEASARQNTLARDLRDAGLANIVKVESSRLFFLEGDLDKTVAERIAHGLLLDSVTESASVVTNRGAIPALREGLGIEVHLKPGVMDPVADSTLAELRAADLPVDSVRTARRYILVGDIDETRVIHAVTSVLANDCIEHVVLGAAEVKPAPKPPVYDFTLRHADIRTLDNEGLRKLSREGHLFLSLEEMQALQTHYLEEGREPTDLELETLAQTWSEHCVHKTLKSAIEYRGAPMGLAADARDDIEIHYDNLLSDTIARATRELMDEGRGPECLSVFEDNAGVIGFDDQFAIAFKVETHNHPSAIEPYGGAATGVGGCIRDVLGCGLGAQPIANTDVFCVAPSDWPQDMLPKGVLHPKRILRGVVKGVSDYGNRMGIPTVNGAVCFDPRYLGNPLVYVGCVGVMPRDKVQKAARPGDRVVVVGGRTGRDGIHGATFSSSELTDTHADEFSHAVQIGAAITEKRCLDALLRARDHEAGCLYTAVTDCGAGGLSSAVGEMGEQVGATVDLDDVPLKYAGLRYDEIWISEAQERMVFAVPPEDLEEFLTIMREEEAEATVIGTFGSDPPASPRLIVRYAGVVVGDLEMRFLHHGLPKRRQIAEWRPSQPKPGVNEPVAELDLDCLKTLLGAPNIASKEWIIRQYDHEVMGGSVVKPLGGPGAGPGDAAVLQPRLDSTRGVALGVGVAAHLSDVDPYWAALASIDEALRNVISVGGDPDLTAILDNFCWGSCDDPRQLGTLVRACQGCYDASKTYGVPFISGKDSLNNEFALHPEDVDAALKVMEDYARAERRDIPHSLRVFTAAAEHVRASNRLRIPGTLLISAVSLVEDVRRCVTSDLKRPGGDLLLIGGLPQIDYSLDEAARIHHAVAEALRQGLIAACHDVSEGGWLVTVAEMALAGDRGVELKSLTRDAGGTTRPGPFAELCATYVLEADSEACQAYLEANRIPCERIGQVVEERSIKAADQSAPLADLRSAWAS